MPLYLTNLPVQPNGNINVSSFVMVDPTVQNGVVQASGSNFLLGISQAGPDQAPGIANFFAGSGAIVGPAGLPGIPMQIFYGGDTCSLTVGSGTVNPGDLLGNDGNGNGLTVAPGSGKWYGALAFSSGSPGDVIKVLCVTGKA